jgi:predicted SprT family Zn-dependent metalloprotease
MATPAALAAARLGRANKVAELAEEARRLNPPDTLADARGRIAESAEPGGVAASNPEPVPVTFRQAVSRWYEAVPGGFDAAVENSQRALREHGAVYPHSNSPAYGNWSPEDVDKPTPVRVNWKLGPFDARGTYGGASREVQLNPAFLDAAPKGINPVVEHELTHALLDKGRSPGLLGSEEWRNASQRFDDTAYGSATLAQNPQLAAQYSAGGPDAFLAEKRLRPLVENENYLMQRAELDPRIAEVRRRYAFYTGKDVLTPEDAAGAWEWWRANREWLEDLSTPTDLPSMMRSHFDTYDALPASSKQIMFKRMTQIPAVLAPLAIGAGAQQQQPGVLSGLTETR